MNDLLGQKLKPRGKNYVEPRGYVAPPGSGPDGETCGNCKNHLVISRAKRYHKCNLIKFTNGPATDIRVKSPACHRWEKEE